MTSPMLRAITEGGATYDDPSEDMIFELLTDIERSNGAESYLIVERLSDPAGQTYAQTLRDGGGGFVVEYRDGAPDRHFQAHAADLREAHAVLSGWAHELPDWSSGRDWTRLEL